MFGQSQFAALASLVLAAAGANRPLHVSNGQVVTRAAGLSRAFAAPYGRRRAAWIAPSYPRKDRANTAAQVKRASKKARNVAKHRRLA